MDRHRTANQGREQPRTKNTNKNKENPMSDTVFLIQNQNDVLRMKNTELNNKIKQLKLQLQIYTDSIALQEVDIDNIKNQIKTTTFKEDIQIENQKKMLTQKLILLKSHQDIMLRKIKEAREATIFEEEKVAQIQNDRKAIEVEILSLRAQNEGTKIVLQKIEDENEDLRIANEALIGKRKIFEPKQKQVSIQIEEKIKFIKNQQLTLKKLKKTETSKLFCSIFNYLLTKNLRKTFSKIERYSLIRKIAQKKVIQLGLIKKKYLLIIKSRTMQKLRESFKPLIEQQTARKIIAQTHKRRIKTMIWRKWRTAAKQAQFSTTRKFECQNTLQKIGESLIRSNIFACFNMLKYYKNNPYHQRSVLIIDQIWNNFMNRFMVHFFSALRTADHRYAINQQIQSSSKQQSQLLVRSLYFTAWAKISKAHAIENLSIKRRHFKELKKLVALKRRRKLGEVLTAVNGKLNTVQTLSKNFFEMKKEATISRLESLSEQEQAFRDKRKDLEQQIADMHADRKALYQELALIKVSKYLKTKVQKAFNLWRLRKQQSKVILTIMNLVESKKAFDKNFGFAQILKKRFAMLKKSINDKIASCQFSYNYLLDQNKHIKEVLDSKTHDLEKSKFMTILQKICRKEKEMKVKYLYRFMRSGYKFWKFRKVCQRIDKMAEQKIKMVFMWLLKKDIMEEKQIMRVETFVQGKEKIINNRLCRNSLRAFESNRNNNKNLKRVLGGIFERNLELDFFVAFGKIRNQQHLHYRGLIQTDINELQGQIDKINTSKAEEQKKMATLKQRLSQKEDTLAERKILALYNFYVKSIKFRFSSYIQRWNNRVKRENRVMSFAKILERKTRGMLKNRFMQYINKKNQDIDITELQQKHKKFQNQYETMAAEQEKFLKQHEAEITRMNSENEIARKEGQLLEKKTDFMNKLKLKSHSVKWSKKVLRFCFKGWRQQTDIFFEAWRRVNYSLDLKVLRQNFGHFIKEMREEVYKFNLRQKLEKIYTKKWKYNIGLGFKQWKYTLLDKRVDLWTEEEKRQMERFEGLEKRYKYAVNKHDGQLKYRQFDPKIRANWNIWRQYAQNRKANKTKKAKLESWLFKGAGSDLLRLIKKKVLKKIAYKQRLNRFIKKWQQIRIRAFMQYTRENKTRRKSFDRLFVHKWCPFMMHKIREEVFSSIKNYGNFCVIVKKEDRTKRIQTVIEVFEKKRRAILSFNVRKWRRNQYQIKIARNLMRRLTKNAMNWRVRDLFYEWKLECEAKRVKQMHEEEGEIKKRQIQINRLKLFLEDFKKQKGLLLEDESGKFVVSPRFQEKKDQQVKRDNNLRYRFISRLILSMNGYSGPAKAYNNLRTYMMVRQKYKKCAKFTRNNLRRPDLYFAFRIWHKASAEFTKMFDTMQRKGLIKILNRQKDKMQMQYSKKLNLQEKIHDEMRLHKLLSYHQDRKQKLAVHLLLKNVRKIKLYTILTWKDRVRQSKEHEAQQLEEQGNNKMNELEEQINELENTEHTLRSNNEQLELAVSQAVDIAEMVKRITEERDFLSKLILEKLMTCESLQQQNEILNAKLYQAQKQAMNLLILSGEKL